MASAQHTGTVIDWAVWEWHALDLRIGFMTGCFDPVHPGHLKVIDVLSTVTNRIIVAVNDDDYIRQQKGREPQQTQDSRMAIMAAIKGVNFAVSLDDGDPSQLIANIEPDVVAVGSDYKESDIKGLDIIKSYGGSVLFVERDPVSSSQILSVT